MAKTSRSGVNSPTSDRPRRIRMLIADDHPAFRDGLCRLLEDESDIQVVARASDGEEAVRLVKELSPEVAVVDVAMPKLNGIEVTKQIKACCPGTQVLIVSAHNIEAYMLAALRSGAAGYLLKTAPLAEIVNAIRLVHSGGGVFDLKAGSRMMSRLVGQKGESRTGETLHARELEVLKLVAKGMGNKEIAKNLVISERTVHTHLINIFRKLDVGSRTEAVLYALKEGWLALEDLP
ncbi:MAG: response regulator transcription factor [Chloroflexota bacterium]